MGQPAQNPFAILPWQVAFDERLGKRHLRVLIALLSFRDPRTTAPFWATRDQISERCGFDIHRISDVTRQLVKMGWLTKHGEGRTAVRYEFHVPETINSPLETNPTVTKTVTVNGYQNGNPLRPSKNTRSETLGRARKRATPMPDDFTLTPGRRLEAQKRRVGEPEFEFEKFRAYHQARGNTMRDWDAAWRTWCMNHEKFSNTNGHTASSVAQNFEGML